MQKTYEHTFQFKASEIAEAAKKEATYHETKVEDWQKRADKALVTVKKTIGAKIVEVPVTNGKHIDVQVDYGDKEAWREYQLATGKVSSHRDAAEQFRVDQRVYETQDNYVYELSTEDVRYFRLGGEPRED